MSGLFTADGGRKETILQTPTASFKACTQQNLPAEENIHKLCPTHQLLIGLDCIWSRRQRARHRQGWVWGCEGGRGGQGLPSQIINHSKPTLKCFFSRECNSNRTGRKTSQRMRRNHNMHQQAKQNQAREKLQYIASEWENEHISIFHPLISLRTTDWIYDHSVQFGFLVQFSGQNGSAARQLITAETHGSLNMNEDFLIFRYFAVIASWHANTTQMKCHNA